MVETVTRLSDQHGIDNFFRLHYRQRAQESKKILNPFEPIHDKDLCLGLIENSNLVPRRLMVTERDRELVRLTIPQTSETIEFGLPGKSAIIILDKECCNREFGKKLAKFYLSVKPDKDHHTHLATVRDIEEAGWLAYWVPLQLEWKILHAQLISKRTLLTGNDPTETDAISLAKAFTKIC
jgi:hypothetical protein